MHSLRTYRLFETLNGGLGVTIPADYAFQAPDRFESRVHGEASGSRTVWIGGTRYSQNRPGGR